MFVSSLNPLGTFCGIDYFCLTKSSFFEQGKSNLDADFIAALECITHST